jgi:hypothetical protein
MFNRKMFFSVKGMWITGISGVSSSVGMGLGASLGQTVVVFTTLSTIARGIF